MTTLTCVFTLATSSLVLLAWALWLLFNYLIAKRHGLEGLKATPPIARSFAPRDWTVRLPRFTRSQQDSADAIAPDDALGGDT